MDGPPPQRILIATIAALEASGLQGITVRGIAEAAGVNVAAISYYFGGKDRLVAAALDQTLEQAFDEPLRELDEAIAAGRSPREALFAILDELVLNALRFPRIARAHLTRVAPDDPLPQRLDAFLHGLHTRLAPHTGADLRLPLTQLWCTFLFATMAPHLGHGFTGIDLADPDDRRAWVTALLDAHLPHL